MAKRSKKKVQTKAKAIVRTPKEVLILPDGLKEPIGQGMQGIAKLKTTIGDLLRGHLITLGKNPEDYALLPDLRVVSKATKNAKDKTK